MSAWNQLQEIIAASGPVGFDELVNVSLYDPDHGWYSGGGRSGRGDGHFITSPEVGPLFGRIVARWLDGCWNAAGRPGEFIVAEVGAGRGGAGGVGGVGCGEVRRVSWGVVGWRGCGGAGWDGVARVALGAGGVG